MLTGLKMSSLTCNCVQRRNHMEQNFGGPERQKWNIQTNRSQNVDEKNGVICLVFMFTPEVLIITMLKMAPVFFSCWWQKMISHSLGKIFKFVRKIFFSFFGKCHWLFHSELPLARSQPLKIQGLGITLLTQQFFDISILDISRTVTF